jgi:hypothetical protein
MSVPPLARALAAAIALVPLLGGAAGAACIPDILPADYLRQQENAGGHTIARHVGKTDAQLVQRLADDPRIRAASSYTDAATAQANIAAALAADRVAINIWAAAAPDRATRAWDAGSAAVVGRVASRPPGLGNIARSTHLRVVIRKTGADTCLLLTSFPIPNRDE